MDTIIQIPNFINEDKKVFNNLLNNIKWNKINYFKRHICHYNYDNENYEVNEIIKNIQTHFKRNVVSVFLNYYENGNEFAPYHSDKYGYDTCLVSLGITRILRYKNNNTKENKDFTLNSGDLLYIPDEINSTYKHSLLKRTKIDKPRISILLFLENK